MAIKTFVIVIRIRIPPAVSCACW